MRAKTLFSVATSAWRQLCVVTGAAITLSACHLSDVLKVPTPLGEASYQQVQNQGGAEQLLVGAEGNIYEAWDNSLLQYSELLTDEATYACLPCGNYSAGIDARITAGSTYPNFYENGDYPWQSMLQQREQLLVTIPLLRKYEKGINGNKSKIGEAYAMLGFVETLVAETYCDGTPLDTVSTAGGITYGYPVSDDTLYQTAIRHFDSAVAYASGNDTVAYLANIGLSRALMDHNQYDSAAAVAATVPASFVWNAQFQSGFPQGPPYVYDQFYYNYYYSCNGCVSMMPSNNEGINGLNYMSANDPRLKFDTTQYTNADGATTYMPDKFVQNFQYVPFATGVESALDVAEGALHDGNTTGWLNDLNALRNSGFSVKDTGTSPNVGPDTTWLLGSASVTGQTVGLAPLADPGTDSGRVSLMFRERAFWLFWTGTRLGDLRRLVRQYNRPTESVYPTGSYLNGQAATLSPTIVDYGKDVAITLPTPAAITSGFPETNPHYKGCTSPTTQA